MSAATAPNLVDGPCSVEISPPGPTEDGAGSTEPSVGVNRGIPDSRGRTNGGRCCIVRTLGSDRAIGWVLCSAEGEAGATKLGTGSVAFGAASAESEVASAKSEAAAAKMRVSAKTGRELAPVRSSPM